MSQDYLFVSDQGIDTGVSNDTSPSAQARRGLELETLRSGTYSQVESELSTMERNGEICIITQDVDDVLLSQAKELLDCDIDFSDEDELPLEEHQNGSQISVWCDGDWTDAYSAFESAQKLEISVCLESDGNVTSCSIKKDPRIGFDCATPSAADKLNEISTRYDILAHIGEWLLANRKNFLRTCDWWDFACSALKEAKNKKASVIQADLIEIAELDCRKDSFSRFIKNVALSWGKDGRMDINLFFSKRAKCAWVARAFRDFCLEEGLSDMKPLVRTLQMAKMARNAKKMSLNEAKSLGTDGVAAYLCGLAGVGGANVAELYADRIMENKEA